MGAYPRSAAMCRGVQPSWSSRLARQTLRRRCQEASACEPKVARPCLVLSVHLGALLHQLLHLGELALLHGRVQGRGAKQPAEKACHAVQLRQALELNRRWYVAHRGRQGSRTQAAAKLASREIEVWTNRCGSQPKSPPNFPRPSACRPSISAFARMASEAEISPPELGTLQAGLRLRRLQRLAASLGLDGLLAVPGLDGRFNAGSAQLLGHLLQGTSNRDAADAVHLSAELLDSVLLLTQQGVAAYAPSIKTASQLSEMLGDTVPGVLQVVSPTPAEASDPDAVEECKLGTFVQMLRGMQRLGIPWAAASATPAAPKPMELEKWPLLQAYGLEGVGRAGFFTQNFQVRRCTALPCTTAWVTWARVLARISAGLAVCQRTVLALAAGSPDSLWRGAVLL